MDLRLWTAVHWEKITNFAIGLAKAFQDIWIFKKRIAFACVRKRRKFSKMQGSKRFSRHRRGLLFPHLHLQVSYDLLTKVWQLAHAFIFNIILYGPNRTRCYMPLFYIEDVFNLVEMQNRSIGIQFNPLSTSYRKYPFGITLKTISNQDLKTIVDRITG